MMAAYQRQTIRAISGVAAGILLAVLAVNACLVVFTATSPDWLPRQFFGVDFIADNRQRARAAADWLAAESNAADSTFVAIIGLSSASEGVTLDTLSEQVADGTRVLGLAGGGRNMRDVARYAEPLLATQARPALVVLAISPFHLMDPPSSSDAFVRRLARAETLDELRGYWFISRRSDIKYAVDAGIDRLQSSAFTWFDARVTDTRDPWREVMRMGLPQAAGEADWRNNVARYGERGYYEAENYRLSSEQPSILRSLIADLEARGARTLIVLMPEHSRLRAEIPDAPAMSLLTRAVPDGEAIQIVDLRSAVPDSGFKDISHMNASGRESFGPRFAEAVSRVLAAE